MAKQKNKASESGVSEKISKKRDRTREIIRRDIKNAKANPSTLSYNAVYEATKRKHPCFGCASLEWVDDKAYAPFEKPVCYPLGRIKLRLQAAVKSLSGVLHFGSLKEYLADCSGIIVQKRKETATFHTGAFVDPPNAFKQSSSAKGDEVLYAQQQILRAAEDLNEMIIEGGKCPPLVPEEGSRRPRCWHESDE